jgi:glycosyltransferase involved in cell wall biosynthesis
LNTLVIITPGFPASESDSTTLPAIQNFTRQWKRLNTELNVIIIALQYPHSRSPYFWNQVQVIPLDGKRFKRFTRPLLWMQAWKKIFAIRKRSGATGLLSFWCQDGALIGRYFSLLFSVPHYCWVMGQDAKESNLFIKLIRPQANELIALSAFLAETFHRSHQIRPAHIVPIGIDPSQFPSPQPATRSIDLLGVGSLITLKQYDHLIRIVSQLVTYFPSLRVVICGDGPERKNLEQLAERLGLISTIIFAGECTHTDTLSLMCDAKVLLHPSSYEGYSTACLEALYAGCHVISYCAAEQREIEHWHIVKTMDEMEEQCKQVLEMSPHNFFSVMPHTIDNTIAEILNLYKPAATE